MSCSGCNFLQTFVSISGTVVGSLSFNNLVTVNGTCGPDINGDCVTVTPCYFTFDGVTIPFQGSGISAAMPTLPPTLIPSTGLLVTGGFKADGTMCDDALYTSILNPPGQPFIVFYINSLGNPIGAVRIQHACRPCV